MSDCSQSSSKKQRSYIRCSLRLKYLLVEDTALHTVPIRAFLSFIIIAKILQLNILSLLRRTLGLLSKISEQVDLFAVVFLLYECYNIIFIMKDDASSVMGAFGNTGT